MTTGNYIIVGCGRVGSTVARRLDAEGQEVVVVDRRREAFRRLGEGFGGRMITGVGFDRDLLRSAGIGPQSAVMAVTNGDNSNILIARVAREMFGVERVVARIYDPRRAAIYERLGIRTVATVSWASTRVHQLVMPGSEAVEWVDPTSRYALTERRVPLALVGSKVSDFGRAIVLLTRDGSASVPAPDTLLQEGDTVHLLATAEDTAGFDASGTAGGGHR